MNNRRVFASAREGSCDAQATGPVRMPGAGRQPCRSRSGWPVFFGPHHRILPSRVFLASRRRHGKQLLRAFCTHKATKNRTTEYRTRNLEGGRRYVASETQGGLRNPGRWGGIALRFVRPRNCVTPAPGRHIPFSSLTSVFLCFQPLAGVPSGLARFSGVLAIDTPRVMSNADGRQPPFTGSAT
jgi:hypothetical protein